MGSKFRLRLTPLEDRLAPANLYVAPAAASEGTRAISARHRNGALCCTLTLLRHRAGVSEKRWQVEWNRDRSTFEIAEFGETPDLGRHAGVRETGATGRVPFQQPSTHDAPALSRPVVPVASSRALAA